MAVPRWMRTAVTLASLLGLTAARTAVAQQGMLVPVPSQAMLVERILTFDRALEAQADTAFVIAVLYQPAYSASRDVRSELESYAATSRATAWGRPVRWRFIGVEGTARVRAELQAVSADAVYLAPMRAIDVRQLTAEAASLHLVSYSGLPDHLRQGAAVAFGVRASRPRILINLATARRAGADFTSQLLQLADLTRDDGSLP